ncbi:MAG: biotin transporter BioY [Methanolinea sp.]|jgi:biotin transport system substrate-specific component|nr:biotin transporter BioY [Methanolinea sp.]
MLSGRERALFIAHTGTFAALLAVGSWVSVPFVPVPLTLQTLFLFLAAGFMGRYAVAPVLLFLLLGALNFPVFHNGAAGIGVFLGPTGGYLLGFVPAAFVAGLCFERRSWQARWAGMGAGASLYYACGIAWLAYSSGLSLPAAILVGAVPFVPGDLLKAFAAYTVVNRVSRIAGVTTRRGEAG